MNQHATRLDAAVRAVCPIIGVSVGVPGDSATVTIDFDPSATAQQRAAAQAVADSFDWSQAAGAVWAEDQKPQRKNLRQQAAQAVADNDTYLALGSPSNAQVAAQVRKLTQQNNRIIPWLIQID